jgi:catechol 2,3-dioxygenase-like lactoylglutathione lyase family enzyme
MLQTKNVFSGFSVVDLDKTQVFYSQILGLKVKDNNGMGLEIQLPSGARVFVYQKDHHEPATYTMLNFVVDSIDTAVDELVKLGVSFEKYEGFGQDEKGIARGISQQKGPDIAWFKDPSGNILSILQEK